MYYVIIQKNEVNPLPVKNQLFKSKEEAEIERIYLQPEYDDLLVVKPIV